ncbi:alpha/beta fold hydrolase [Geodermatophilus sp. SYSU D01186]
MTHFVLVHGSWCGGWVWDDLVTHLEKDGHRVTVVTQLPSSGTDPATLGDLRADAEHLRGVVRGAGEPVVLVGHSYGGMVVAELADDPGVAQTVYLAALRPRRGQSVLDLLGGGPLPPWVVPRDDGTLAVTRDVDTVRTHVCAELPLEEVARFVERLGLQSAAALASPSTAPDPAHPVSYVVCTLDAVLPADAQEAMAAGADRVVRLESSHMVQMVMPDRLAQELETLLAAPRG